MGQAVIEVELIEGSLSAAPVLDAAGGGAAVRFDGVVRPSEGNQPIEGLRYEAYPPMTQKLLHRLAEDCVAEHGLLALRCRHSVGFVPIHACSFSLEVAAMHRAEAIAAVGSFIDRMKQDVPLWKVPVMRDASVRRTER